LSSATASVAELLNQPSPMEILAENRSSDLLIGLEEITSNSIERSGDRNLAHFLSPVDLQPVKASGVTFFESLIERVIEERAGGCPERTAEIRVELISWVGRELDDIRPGTDEARKVLAVLRRENLWSQYLEVGLGDDAEIFSKAAPLATVGFGAEVGVLRHSSWNNPEPEVTLLINCEGEIVGVTLGNDVNHRDIEGRSALLLGRAKDNNSACSLGPFIRLVDESFGLDAVRKLAVTIEVVGTDGFRETGRNNMKHIRRDVLDLAGQCLGPNNSYPDGVALMLGSMVSLQQDRIEENHGFTHRVDDLVRIHSPGIGTLINRVRYCDEVKKWDFGIGAFLSNRLAQ